MSRAYKCDKCGELYYKDVDSDDFKLFKYSACDNRSLFEPRPIDLCPKCNQMLDELLDNPNTTVIFENY